MPVSLSDPDDPDLLDAAQRPRVGAWRLLIALLQGALLYWLYRAGVDKAWPASVPTLFVPLLLVAVLCPVLAIVSLGHLAPRRLLWWTGGVAVLVAALGWYDAWRRAVPGHGSDTMTPTPLLFVHLVAGLFIAHTLVAAASAERRRIASYPTYFDAAWKLAVQLVFSAGFVGAVWLVLNLGGELFKLIKLNFLDQLLRKAWFNIPVIVFAFACAVHVTDVRPAIVRGIRGLMLALMAWLLPVVTILVGGFLLSLPFTGLSALWATRHAAATLLGSAALLVLMINAAWQNGAALPALAAPLRWSARLAALLLAPLVAIAAWALQLRVADYGWTDDRIVAGACIVVAACYAAGYLVAALRSSRLERIARVNIGTAFVVLAVTLVLFSPLGDPARISVDSQLARLNSGKVTPDKFDYAYLRFHGERYGRDALAELERTASGPNAAAIKAGVAQARAAVNRWEAARPVALEPAGLLANLTVWPRGTTLPPAFISKRDNAGRLHEADCLRIAGQRCDVFALDLGGGAADLLVLGENSAAVYGEGADGVWRVVETLPFQLATCPVLRQRLIAGQFKTVKPARKVLEIDGKPILPSPAISAAPACPGSP